VKGSLWGLLGDTSLPVKGGDKRGERLFVFFSPFLCGSQSWVDVMSGAVAAILCHEAKNLRMNIQPTKVELKEKNIVGAWCIIELQTLRPSLLLGSE
jgi:hypothetical protein